MFVAYRKHFDWAAMQREIDRGAGFKKCNRLFGIAHATWKQAIEAGDILFRTEGRPYADARRRYNWAEIREYYEAGNSLAKCRHRFGFTVASWHKAVRRGEIVPRHWEKLPLSMFLLYALNRHHIKSRLIREGRLTNRCEHCGINSWQGRKLVIQIDHINGDGRDYRLENLRMLCPNCHSQTPTYGGNNHTHRKRLARSTADTVV
jgi:hypothetical protein